MPRHIIHLIFLIALFASCSAITFCQPKLKVIGGFNPDYGTIYSNQPMKKEIILKNVGTDTLTIGAPSSSCGCTVAKMNDGNIPPDSTGKLFISFDPSRFSGSVTKGISFETNDPNQAHVHIDFTVRVSKAYEISADYLSFPNAAVDSVWEEEYTLKNVTEKPMKILSLLSTSYILTAEIDKKVIEPKDYATIRCRVRPTTKGIFKGNINIDTDCPDIPHISTRFFGFAKAKAK
jgi:hypothetical protein